MLAKQLEGVQENKKERPSIMSCTAGLPSSWCWTSSVTVALLGQGGVCFDCRCNKDCHSITTTPISSCIMHVYSAYFFQIMAKPICREGLFYMGSQRSLTDAVQRASKEAWFNNPDSSESTTKWLIIFLQWSNVSISQLDKCGVHQ